ncbi:hypothetical protein [Aquipuribacter hungaricus]|uniref:hypothetical protein n=1 Tax=Aquipuribacter hungaricus TaxID=545624 RepID=UPI0030EB1456
MNEQAVRSTGRQSVRQAARRAVLDAQSARRRERAEREQRVEALVVEVLVAVRERDAAIASAEARAGAALDRIVQQERLTVREVVDWCADGALSTREVARLRAVAARAAGSVAPPAAPTADPSTSLQIGGGERGRVEVTADVVRPPSAGYSS